MGAGKSLNGREKNSGEEKSRTTRRALLVVLDFSSPEFFSRPFRLFPAPTNCPWVSEDGEGEAAWENSQFDYTVHVNVVDNYRSSSEITKKKETRLGFEVQNVVFN